MAVLTPAPTHPTIAATVADLTGGAGPGTLGQLNDRQDTLEARDDLLGGLLEKIITAGLGNGAVTGGTVSGGTGLSANVAAGSAFVGSWVGWDATIVVGGLAASATNRLWLWQNGSFTVTQSGTVPTDATRGIAFLWGTATTDASSVTSVDNTVRILWPAAVRTALGLGTMATQAASAVAITGGSIAGITDLAVADGGTGASTATAARTNLGLGSVATLNAIGSANMDAALFSGSVALAPLTGGGTAGSLTLVNGVITAYSAPT